MILAATIVLTLLALLFTAVAIYLAKVEGAERPAWHLPAWRPSRPHPVAWVLAAHSRRYPAHGRHVAVGGGR